MKTVLRISFPVLIALIMLSSLSLSQVSKSSEFTQFENRYKCEDDLIEIMFIESSTVRMRNGQPTDLKTNATAGLNEVLSALEWHQWARFCDVQESKMNQWALDGERIAGRTIYNLNNIYSLKIPKGHDVWQICGLLEELPGIHQARPYPLPVEPPLPPDYQNNQGYLKQATLNPSGVDALYAWTQSGGTGTGITICDLEYSWNYNHADITKAIGSTLNSWTDPGYGNDHGTAVIGQLVADNNGWGITGICHGSNLLTCGTYYASPTLAWNVPGAMALAISNLSAGDIILIEQQWDYNGNNGYVPIEWWTNTNTPQTNNAVYAAIVNAVANGIHVVEAGGNGNMNTDLMNWFGNSGAIIVGAGGGFSYNNRERLSFSSFGSRFNLQGWGQNVTTTGYGNLYNADGVNYFYTSTFSGTSSASPIVTGALACAEGYYLANISSTPPSPAFMRSHLATHSQPQIFGPAGNIGPRPDLYQAITAFQPPLNQYDFSDAPDPTYPTLLVNNGARHLINPAIYMGSLIDADSDGQPHLNALGDDNTGSDDEDGVFFTSIIMAGQTNTITVFASVTGYLNAWMDFNYNGSWTDPGEHVFVDLLLIPGPNNLVYNVPLVPYSNFTFTRFRFSTVPNLTYTGLAPNGEVEDYEILINEAIQYDYDLGDAADPSYPTLLANNGAHHFIDPTIFLGYTIDGDPDGQPDPSALGDDNDGNDDEDGVLLPSQMIPGQAVTIDVVASVQGILNTWIDQDINGSWSDPGDHIFIDVPLYPGVNTLTFIASPGGFTGYTFARFRFSTVAGLNYAGPAPDGEVEDYMIYFGNETQDIFDWGDAPDSPYPSYAASNGAHHLIVPGIFLGTSIDPDLDGQPDPSALGDDNDGNDDEDGVIFNNPFIPGQPATIDVTASASGILNVWIDQNFNGSWADLGDHVFVNIPLIAGVNSITFIASPGGWIGNTFARFRFSTVAGLSYTGSASDGEVEDYTVNFINALYKINIRAILGGAFLQSSVKNKSIAMNTSLKSLQYLPLQQPYNNPAAIWHYPGSESVSEIPQTEIVDWVVLELRQDQGSTKSPNSFVTIDKQAAFLLSDGTIVTLDGISPPQFSFDYIDNLFAVVWHRNHIGIMSANPLTFDGIETYSYDFTSGPNQAFGGMNAQIEVAPGIFGMISGDASGDGNVDAADYLIWRNSSGVSGYEPADFNLDSQVENKDKNDKWLPNLGAGTYVPY